MALVMPCVDLPRVTYSKGNYFETVCARPSSPPPLFRCHLSLLALLDVGPRLVTANRSMLAGRMVPAHRTRAATKLLLFSKSKYIPVEHCSNLFGPLSLARSGFVLWVDPIMPPFLNPSHLILAHPAQPNGNKVSTKAHLSGDANIVASGNVCDVRACI